MNIFFRFKSLRTRLAFWFITVTMISLMTVVTIIYFQRVAFIRTWEFEKLQTIRDLKVRELNLWLNQRMGDVKVSANDEEIRALGKVWETEGIKEDMAALSTARALLQRYMDHYDAYREFFIINAESGKVAISTTPTAVGRDKKKDLYFTEVMRTRKPYIKDIYYSKIDGRPMMAFSAPIFCLEHDGKHLIGVEVARINLEHALYPLLLELTGGGETGETLIVNKDGVALNELRWYKNAPLKLRITAEPAVKSSAGESGIVETEDYRGEMVLAAYTHIPMTGWGFVAKRDIAEVYAPIHAMLRDMVLTIAVAAILVLIASLLVAGTIARPIRRIVETIQRFTGGDLGARCPTTGADEVFALEVSFNNMAETLASQIATRQGCAGISDTMVAAGNVETFSSGLLMKLIDISGSNLGAFYLRGEDGKIFEQIASVGLSTDSAQSFNAEGYEGELGQALATGSISLIRDIPAETVFTFKTTGGTAIPREIISIPLTVNGRVMAVVSLATLGSYSRTFRQILEQAQLGMNTAFSILLAGVKTERLAKELSGSNEEMAAVNEELQQQTEELQEQAEELQAQTAKLEDQRQHVLEASRLKSEFLSNMSHELRTPLNSVMALSQLMLSRGVGTKPEEDAEQLRVIARNGRRLLDLINDILDLSKIEAGRVELSFSDFDPRELVERTLGTVRPMADEKGLALETKFNDVQHVYSDEARVSQILLNLLSNAVKFTEHGKLGVEVSAAERMVFFAVTDTGIGVSGADISIIFEEFRQVDGSITRNHKGTGLGLAICRKLARMLGGEITVESTPGAGSTFTLCIPERGREAHGEVAAPVRTDEAKKGTRRRRQRGPVREKPLVLVVDDNETSALQVRTALEENGYRVTVSGGGRVGLSTINKEVPDAIILDLMMPGMDGFQVLEQLRSTPSTVDVPVLILTARDLGGKDRARLRHSNIQDLIQKGNLDRDTLLARVARMIEEPEEPEPGTAPAAATTGEVLSPPPVWSNTILIVEDNPDNLLTIKAILDDMQCQYIAALDGAQAVKAAKESRPGLILMDIQLPVMSGFEAIRQIKADPDLKGTPIVALTAKAMKGDREEFLAAGCVGYLTKPLDGSKLKSIVRKWLGLEKETS